MRSGFWMKHNKMKGRCRGQIFLIRCLNFFGDAYKVVSFFSLRVYHKANGVKPVLLYIGYSNL
jgi:hypothetical protein